MNSELQKACSELQSVIDRERWDSINADIKELEHFLKTHIGGQPFRPAGGALGWDGSRLLHMPSGIPLVESKLRYRIRLHSKLPAFIIAMKESFFAALKEGVDED